MWYKNLPYIERLYMYININRFSFTSQLLYISENCIFILYQFSFWVITKLMYLTFQPSPYVSIIHPPLSMHPSIHLCIPLHTYLSVLVHLLSLHLYTHSYVHHSESCARIIRELVLIQGSQELSRAKQITWPGSQTFLTSVIAMTAEQWLIRRIEFRSQVSNSVTRSFQVVAVGNLEPISSLGLSSWENGSYKDICLQESLEILTHLDWCGM